MYPPWLCFGLLCSYTLPCSTLDTVQVQPTSDTRPRRSLVHPSGWSHVVIPRSTTVVLLVYLRALPIVPQSWWITGVLDSHALPTSPTCAFAAHTQSPTMQVSVLRRGGCIQVRNYRCATTIHMHAPCNPACTV
ncbi:hypothetical protein GGR57DRAFT_485563 [Xylariaceae sp. FL1272]|nr:hypothetical protein GGR57DRAFT_485563 [Xylariaceae sp. FL1272]